MLSYAVVNEVTPLHEVDGGITIDAAAAARVLAYVKRYKRCGKSDAVRRNMTDKVGYRTDAP